MGLSRVPWSEVYRVLGGDPALRSLVALSRAIMGEDEAHGWPHIVRVAGWAESLRRTHGGDPRILYAALLLHDAGRSLPGGGHHAVKSANLAYEILPSLGYDSREVEAVVHAILAHSYSLGVRAESVEAMILSDADKLDALGVVGVARAFITGSHLGRSISDSIRHMEEKLLRLPRLMYFEESRRAAEALLLPVKSMLEHARREGLL